MPDLVLAVESPVAARYSPGAARAYLGTQIALLGAAYALHALWLGVLMLLATYPFVVAWLTPGAVQLRSDELERRWFALRRKIAWRAVRAVALRGDVVVLALDRGSPLYLRPRFPQPPGAFCESEPDRLAAARRLCAEITARCQSARTGS